METHPQIEEKNEFCGGVFHSRLGYADFGMTENQEICWINNYGKLYLGDSELMFSLMKLANFEIGEYNCLGISKLDLKGNFFVVVDRLKKAGGVNENYLMFFEVDKNLKNGKFLGQFRTFVQGQNVESNINF